MRAIILAAGRGTRLQPLTNNVPKCLVQVHGKSLLQYQLESLAFAGIRECVIVVGYLGDQVKQEIGKKLGEVCITYVTNNVFESTNNIYSLWLAREQLYDDILLIEGDLIFDPMLLTDLHLSEHPDLAVVDKFSSSMNGTIILPQDSFAKSMVLKYQQTDQYQYENTLKTVNIYSFCQQTMEEKLLPAIDAFVARGLTNEFYEAAIAELVANQHLHLGVHLTKTRKWIEIDTYEDLGMAERMFSKYPLP